MQDYTAFEASVSLKKLSGELRGVCVDDCQDFSRANEVVREAEHRYWTGGDIGPLAIQALPDLNTSSHRHAWKSHDDS